MERALTVSLVFGSIGSAATFGALVLVFHHRRVLRGLATTTGTIVATLESDVDGQRMYRRVVEFTPPSSPESRSSFRATDDNTYYGTASWQIGDPMSSTTILDHRRRTSSRAAPAA